jgi:cytochrome c2
MSQELTFKNHGELIKTLSLTQVEKITPAQTVTVFDHLLSEEQRYIGFQVDALLTGVFGEQWKTTEEILFTCSDGYRRSVPSSLFREYSAYLVYSNPDNRKFALANKLQNNEIVSLGPFYLVWDNIKSPEFKAKIGSYWPYQVTTIDLISFSERFPNMSPPDSSNKNVKNGFLGFKQYCMACHTINGDGGEKSIELNYPVSVTEYMKESWLIKWIDNPRGIRFDTTMPVLNQNLKDRETTIKNIIAYLKVMKNNKKKPRIIER